jgi:plasmanylethanolamine desaturase
MLLRLHKPHPRQGSVSPFIPSDNLVNKSDGRAAPPQSSSEEESGAASGPLHRLLELTATILFPVLFISPLLLSCRRLSEAGAAWLVVPGALLGLVFGDFVTGLVHWAADTYGEGHTPLIGRSLVKPFRVHHIRPLEICEHGVVETIGNTCILAAPLLTLFVVMSSGETSAAASFALYTAVVTVGVTVATNQFHKWAHQESPPRVVRALQRARIILSPEHHRAHHTAPFESSYAITNGWLNPLLNRTRFFRRLERALRTFGVRPSREWSGE